MKRPGWLALLGAGLSASAWLVYHRDERRRPIGHIRAYRYRVVDAVVREAETEYDRDWTGRAA